MRNVIELLANVRFLCVIDLIFAIIAFYIMVFIYEEIPRRLPLPIYAGGSLAVILFSVYIVENAGSILEKMSGYICLYFLLLIFSGITCCYIFNLSNILGIPCHS